MKKIILYLLSLFTVIIYNGCEKDPFVSKDVIQHMRDSASAATSVQNICFIYNNDVYFMDNINNTPQKITNTPLNTKTEIRISHNLQKIAYLNSSGNPEIIDRHGNILNTLTSYSGVLQMDWNNNDSTLYMLSGDQFYYYGPTISHPALNFSGIPLGTSPHILSASLSKNNDLAYIVEYFDFTYGYLQKMILKKNDGSGTWVIVDNSLSFNNMRYVKFSINAQDLILGYDDVSGTTYPSLSTLELYSNMNNYPDLTVDYCSSCEYRCPIYRGDKKCILSAFLDASGASPSSNFVLSAYYTNNVTFNNKSGYNSAVSNLIIDWK